MEYRSLKREEILPALHMVWDVFVQDVAPDYTPEGVESFQNYIRYEHILELWEGQNLYLFGAVDKNEVVGVIALQPDGMIRLFYVRKDKQGQGIGRKLFQMAYNCCVQELKVIKIWVHAAPGAVQKYQHLGMVQTGSMQTENGRCYVPLEMTASPTLVKPVKEKEHNNMFILAIVLGILLLVVLLIGGSVLVRNLLFDQIISSREAEDQYDYWGYPDDDYGYDFGWDFGDEYGDYGSGGEADTNSGIGEIPGYESSSLPYEISEDSVQESDESLTSTLIYFNITYPTISGLGDELDEKVNQLLKECAVKTMDEIYTNPSDEIKERVLESSYPVLTSEVSYKICYANENFLSLALHDYAYEGNTEECDSQLRCLNINLKDGSVYQLTDLVNVDETFEQAWLPVMRSETDDSVFLSELSDEQLLEALKGDTLDGVYTVEFFVDENGMEIGFSLHYPTADDENDKGYSWVTAPFTFSEIEKYATDNAFWQNLD